MLVLEEDCREIERSLDGFHGIMYEHAGEIPEANRECIRAVLAKILDNVAAIRLDLGLQKQVVDLERLIGSRLSHIWVTLHESRTESLRGYGVVPESLRQYLDPRVDEILGLYMRLREALHEARIEGKSARASNEVP